MGAQAKSRSSLEPTLQRFTQIGQYEVLDRLAVGGMAEVYLARRIGIEGFEKRVVLKRVLPQLVDDAEFTSMFLNEARLAARLDHPNIVHVTDIGVLDDEFFFVMEYLHGKTLRAVIREAGKEKILPTEFAINVALCMAAGLHHAHECRGADGEPLELVHRDVSPSNVMITFGGHVKLVDFGIAKAAAQRTEMQTRTVKGKVGYMSPEQYEGQPVDRRCDVFAIGVVLYELTCGRRPFIGDNQFAVMKAAVEGRFDPPSSIVPGYPPPLERVVTRAFAADPDDRYATADDFQIALEEAAVEMGIRVSASVVRRFMKSEFDAPPQISAPISAESEAAARSLSSYRTPIISPEDVTVGSLSLSQPRRLPALAIGAIAVTLCAGVGLGAWLFAPEGTDAAAVVAPVPVPSGIVADEADPDPADPNAESAALDELDEPELIVVDADPDAAVAEEPEALPEAEPAPEPRKKHQRSRRPQRSRPAKKPAKSSTKPSKPTGSLFPPSHYDE